jgi:hypothetical protein
MHRFMVKIETAGIFKGVFETRKSTRIEQNFAEFRVWETRGCCVNHVPINHDAAPTGL